MLAAFSEQYALVQGARGVLLDYCATLSPAHFTTPVPAFNHDSIRDLLVHVVRTYHGWLGQVAFGRPEAVIEPAAVPDVAALRAEFARVDALVAEFGQHFAGSWGKKAPFAMPGRNVSLQLTPLELFTHVVTHEFHHKGQALTMSRLLGYVPADTDVIRT